MTRDEAIKIQRRHGPTQLVDILADLGVLKLDKPKGIEERTNAAIWGHPELHRTAPGIVREALSAAGLKIVDARTPQESGQ